MSKRLLVMLFLFPLLLLAALLALSSLGKGRFLRDSGPTRVEYSGHERVGGTNFVLFTFANAEQSAVGLAATLLVQSEADPQVWESTPLEPAELAVVPRGRAFTFRVPVPENEQRWQIMVEAVSRPSMGEKLATVPSLIFGKRRGFPQLRAAVAGPEMRGAEPDESQSQRGASASSAP